MVQIKVRIGIDFHNAVATRIERLVESLGHAIDAQYGGIEPSGNLQKQRLIFGVNFRRDIGRISAIPGGDVWVEYRRCSNVWNAFDGETLRLKVRFGDPIKLYGVERCISLFTSAAPRISIFLRNERANGVVTIAHHVRSHSAERADHAFANHQDAERVAGQMSFNHNAAVDSLGDSNCLNQLILIGDRTRDTLR